MQKPSKQIHQFEFIRQITHCCTNNKENNLIKIHHQIPKGQQPIIISWLFIIFAQWSRKNHYLSACCFDAFLCFSFCHAQFIICKAENVLIKNIGELFNLYFTGGNITDIRLVIKRVIFISLIT